MGGGIPQSDKETTPLSAFKIGKESEKAYGLSATTVLETRGGYKDIDTLIWVPKSIVKEGEIPKWFLQKKLKEVAFEKNYGKSEPYFYNPKTGYNYDAEQMKTLTRVRSKDEQRFQAGKEKHAQLVADAKKLGIKAHVRMKNTTLEQKIREAKKMQ
jgi:hypothetical protein